MSAPGKLETWQQQRAKINASKEAAKIVSKPLKEEPKPIVLEKVEVPVEVELEPLVEVAEEVVVTEPEVQIEEEIKPELKPISKKNKIKE